jgi:hypothetical protein
MVKVREDYAMTGDGQVDIEGWVQQIASQTHLEDPDQFRQACEKAAEIDIVQVQALGRYGRFFMSGSEASVQTALEAATTAIGMVEGIETASQ